MESRGRFAEWFGSENIIESRVKAFISGIRARDHSVSVGTHNHVLACPSLWVIIYHTR